MARKPEFRKAERQVKGPELVPRAHTHGIGLELVATDQNWFASDQDWFTTDLKSQIGWILETCADRLGTISDFSSVHGSRLGRNPASSWAAQGKAPGPWRIGAQVGGGGPWVGRCTFLRLRRFVDSNPGRRPVAFFVLAQSAYQFMHRLNANVVFLAFAWAE